MLHGWQQTTPLNNQWFNAQNSFFTTANYIYIGNNAINGDLTFNVKRARQSSDGSLGAWESVGPVQLKTGNFVFDQSFIVYGGYVYSMGGIVSTSNGTPLAAGGFPILSAKINGDSISGWTDHSDSAPDPAITQPFPALTMIGNRLYSIGGDRGLATHWIHCYSTELSGGNVSAWRKEADMILGGLANTSIVFTRYNRLYCMNTGDVSGAPFTGTTSCKVNSNGTLTNWTKEANVVIGDRAGTGGAVIGDKVYMLGGYNAAFNVEFQDGQCWTITPNGLTKQQTPPRHKARVGFRVFNSR